MREDMLAVATEVDDKASGAIVASHELLVRGALEQSAATRSEVVRLQGSVDEVSSGAAAVEAAIEQGLKLLQEQVSTPPCCLPPRRPAAPPLTAFWRSKRPLATLAPSLEQVSAKASRQEVIDALMRAKDASVDSEERLSLVAQGLDAVTADVKTRAPRERVAELEFVLSQVRLLQEPSAAQKRRLNASAMLPTNCLACNQELPRADTPPPPHLTSTSPVPSRSRPQSASQSRSRPQSAGRGQGQGAAHTHSAGMVGASSQRAKLLYGKEPENAKRSSMMKQMHGLAAADAPSPGDGAAGALVSVLGHAGEVAPEATQVNLHVRPGSAGAGAFKPAMRATPSGSGFRAATAVSNT